ncbi:NADH-quinone oxidoreductase subunit E [Gemmobacter serpentinus]|uniref:NADH-quinone oxidoreductase subunit E n=1 Tax=Gemmobacter serpentinus TaxID=2652247 RepID=UPI00124CDF33|nr:NADH-quinone oxidoreductase subunit E [Gemmobacter serpentinus]
MLRRLHKEQPASFAFTPKNLEWAHGQISKYPEGRQASAVIPLLFRAQEQEGWLTRPAIEYVADMLGMARIRVLEVATFYFMFQLQPVGTVAHIQICGTTSCMICGAEDLIAVCKELIAPTPYTLSADGKFSWEEVECLGACANAPAINIGKDYYEDLSPERLRDMIARFGSGEVPVPGSQIGRYSSEPLNGLTALKEFDSGRTQYNGSVQRAMDIGDTIRRIDGTEVPILTPWKRASEIEAPAAAEEAPAAAAKGIAPEKAEALATGKPEVKVEAPAGVATAAPGQNVAGQNTASGDKPAGARLVDSLPEGEAKAKAKVAAPAAVAALPESEGTKPEGLAAARDGKGDDLKLIEGIGPVLEKLCHELGIFHFDQIAGWGADEIAWMDSNLKGFRGRVTRDKWVSQAKIIVTEGIDIFLERAKTNDY